MSKVNITFTDFGGETTTTGLRGATITSANYDAQVTLITALRAAMEAITLGVQRKYQIVAADNVLSTANAAVATAQREIKWLVTYHDNTSGKQYQSEIGTADLAGHITPGTDFAPLADGAEIQDFVTAFEAFVRAPDDLTHTVTIDSIRVVGRNT